MNKYYQAKLKHRFDRTINEKILCEQYEHLSEYIVVYIRIVIKSEKAKIKQWCIPMDCGAYEVFSCFSSLKFVSKESFEILINHFEFDILCEAYGKIRTIESEYIDYIPVIMTKECLQEIEGYIFEDSHHMWQDDNFYKLLNKESINPKDYWLMIDANYKLKTPHFFSEDDEI